MKPLTLKLTTVLFVCFSMIGCNEAEEPIAGPDLNTFEGVIASGGAPEEPGAAYRTETEQASEDTVLNNEDGIAEVWSCTSKEVELSENNPDFSLYTAGTEVIYPGNLLQGSSLQKATPDIIPLKRQSGRITISTLNGSENVSEIIDEVNYAEVAIATNKIIGANNGQLTANTAIEISEINSEEEIGISMKASYQKLSAKIKGSFDYNKSVAFSSYMVKLTQSFYTLVAEIPSADNLFSDEVSPQQLQRYVYDGNPATYISSVNYGRIFYLLIQSTQSKTEVKAAIDASFDAVLSSGSVEIDAQHVNKLENKRISGYAYGGDANLASGALLGNLENLQTFIKAGGTINNGAPLSYVVRSVYDPAQVVSTALATKYTITNCENVSQGLPVWKNARKSVGAACYVSTNKSGTTALFNQDGLNYINATPEGKLSDPFFLWQWGVDNTCPFRNEGISAATHLRSDKNPKKVYMFNKTGTKWCAYSIEKGKGTFKGPYDNRLWGVDDSMPFEAIGAAMDASLGGLEQVCLFSMEGTEYTIYESLAFSTLRSIKDFQLETNGPVFEIPFDKVGAALRVDLPDKSRTVLAMFNYEGAQYVFFDADKNEFIGPIDM